MTAPARPPLISLDDALSQLLTTVTPLTDVEQVSTMQADGRVLAADITSALHVPALDNSAMDGYALRAADVTAAGVVFPVSQRIAAGSHGTALAAGTVARIFTGAPVPAGADTVVMQEECEAIVVPEALKPGLSVAGDGAPLPQVRLLSVPKMGQHIRRAGEDVSRGAVVLAKGCRLGPAGLGLAASIGLDQLPVVRRPRVALFSTGDELVMPGDCAPADMPPGAIYNSNRFFLSALLSRMGCEVTDLGIVPDQRDATVAALSDAASGHDVILKTTSSLLCRPWGPWTCGKSL